MTGWNQIPGGALDIAISPEGNLWIIGSNQGIYYYNSKKGDWTQVSGGAVKIAVGPNNTPWVVNAGHGIYQWNGQGGWNQLPGAALDIGVGGEGSVWIIGTDNVLYQWIDSERTWNNVNAKGARISVDKNGNPWVVGTDNTISRWIDNALYGLSGAAVDISCASDGSVVVIGTDYNPWRYSLASKGWAQIPAVGDSVNVAVAAGGIINYVSKSTTIWVQSTQRWNKLTGAGSDIGVGADGSVFVIGTDDLPGGNGIWKHQRGKNSWSRISSFRGGVRVSADPAGNPWMVDEFNQVWRWEPKDKEFVLVQGAATDIAVGADGTVWIIGISNVGGGHDILRWTGSKWELMTGGAVRIAVNNKGLAWVVNSNNNIYRWTGSTWQQLSGGAVDIGCGADGSVWITGTDGNAYLWDDASSAWKLIGGASGLVTVSVDKYGNAWVTDKKNTIWNRVDDSASYDWPEDSVLTETEAAIWPKDDSKSPRLSGWEQLPGAALDIGVGADGTWITGTDQGIYNWDEKARTWNRVSGAAVRVSVGVDNQPWVVNSGKGIYKYLGNNQWTQLPGAALDIGVGADGTVCIVGTDNAVYYYLPATNGWNNIGGKAIRVAVDPQGLAWTVDDKNVISRWTGYSWETISGKATDIGIGADYTVWVSGTDSRAWRWSHAGQNWTPVDGVVGGNIAVGPTGVAWATDAKNNIFRQSSVRWASFKGTASFIHAGPDGTIWIVDSKGKLYNWSPKAGDWIAQDRTDVSRAAVDEAGNLHVITTNQQVFKKVGANWRDAKTNAVEIAAAGGQMWILGTDKVQGGFQVYQRKTPTDARSANTFVWNKSNLGAVKLAVNAQGFPWAVDSANKIWRFDGNSWTQVTGAAVSIGCGGDGSTWIIGTDNNVYKWVEATKSWNQITGTGVAITVDRLGFAWVLDNKGNIFRRVDDAADTTIAEWTPATAGSSGETDDERAARFAREAKQSITIAGYATKSVQGTPLAKIDDTARWADFSLDFNYAFDSAPVVAMGISGFILANGPVAGIAVFPLDVTATGFTYRIYVPAGAEAYGVRISWMATNRDSVGVTYILADHDIDNDVENVFLKGAAGERVLTRDVDHPIDMNDAKAVVGLAGFSFNHANQVNPRLDVGVKSIDSNQVTVNFRVWADTQVFGVLAVIVHYDNSPYQGQVDIATDYDGVLFKGSGNRNLAVTASLGSDAAKKYVSFPVLSYVDLEHSAPYRLLEDWSSSANKISVSFSTSGSSGNHQAKDRVFFVSN